MRILWITIFAAFALVPAAVVRAQPKLVKAELLADQANIVAGEPFTVAVKLTINPGWHIYWINPGDSGLPTTVTWNLPDGFTAEPLQYPAPRRIELTGGLVNYGYEDQAVFLARITPPKTLAASGDIPIEAKISWLVCKQNCVKGGGTAKLSLPIADKAQPANEPDFQKWQQLIPRAAEKLTDIQIAADPIDVSKGTGTTQIQSSVPLKDCIAIPGPSQSINITCASPVVTATGTTVSVNAQVLAGQKVTDPSFIVLIVPSDSLAGGYQVTVPIASSSKQSG
jgi:DsbC/DsbD-like thiol-disulfide interchange protein